jgi:hypothetical protein
VSSLLGHVCTPHLFIFSLEVMKQYRLPRLIASTSCCFPYLCILGVFNMQDSSMKIKNVKGKIKDGF